MQRQEAGTAAGVGTVWSVVRQGAFRRLGRPLLLAYLALAVFGVLGVGASVVAMMLGL